MVRQDGQSFAGNGLSVGRPEAVIQGQSLRDLALMALVRSAAIEELGKTKKSTSWPTLAFLILRQLFF